MTYTPSYPDNIPAYTDINPRTDGSDIVSAVDVNSLYAETIQIASALGTKPAARAAGAGWGIGTFDTTTVFSSVKARVNNVENGVYIVYNDYVKKSGGTTITPSGTGTVNLTLTPAASQSVSMLEAKNSSGTVVTYISQTGKFWTNSIDGGSA